MKQNERKRKEKFLEDYFSLCREHGFCVDAHLSQEVDIGFELHVADDPQYKNCDWKIIKKELRESLND